MLKLLFLAGPTREIPSARSRWVHLARSSSQSEHRIRFILLLADSAMYSLRGRRLEMVVKVHCGTDLGDIFSTWRQIRPPNQSHNAL